MQDPLQPLKEKGFSFYWNDADKIWWLTKTSKNGKVLMRTDPLPAKNREDAEKAAINRYVKRNS